MARSDLYFILNPALGIIKIGIAADVRQRLSGLECSCGVPLTVLRVVTAGEDLELPLHDIFGASRLMGEWFLPTEELVSLALGTEDVFAFTATNKARMRVGREAREDEMHRRKVAQDAASQPEREEVARLKAEEKRLKDARKVKEHAAEKKREAKRRQLEQEKRDRIAVERADWAMKSADLAAKVIKPEAAATAAQRMASFAEQRARNAAMIGTVPVEPTATKRNVSEETDAKRDGES